MLSCIFTKWYDVTLYKIMFTCCYFMDFVVASSCFVLNPRSCSCFFEACHGFTWSTIPWAQVLKDPWSVRYTVTRLTLVSTLFEADYIHSYLVPAFLENRRAATCRKESYAQRIGESAHFKECCQRYDGHCRWSAIFWSPINRPWPLCDCKICLLLLM